MPNCNEDGTYATLQCHYGSNFCQCWDKEGKCSCRLVIKSIHSATTLTSCDIHKQVSLWHNQRRISRSVLAWLIVRKLSNPCHLHKLRYQNWLLVRETDHTLQNNVTGKLVGVWIQILARNWPLGTGTSPQSAVRHYDDNEETAAQKVSSATTPVSQEFSNFHHLELGRVCSCSFEYEVSSIHLSSSKHLIPISLIESE